MSDQVPVRAGLLLYLLPRHKIDMRGGHQTTRDDRMTRYPIEEKYLPRLKNQRGDPQRGRIEICKTMIQH